MSMTTKGSRRKSKLPAKSDKALIVLRIDRATREKIAKMATAEHRSVSGQAVFLLSKVVSPADA